MISFSLHVSTLLHQIFNLMKFDSYSRFLKSSLYQECMRAEVDGLPLPDPYQIPCSPAPSKHSASSDRSTLSTPKKVPWQVWTMLKPLIAEIKVCLRISVYHSFSVSQEARKQRSGRSLNDDSKEESADKKRGIFFSWSRNRSFGKGPKKKEIGDINLGEKLINKPSGSKDPLLSNTQTSKVLKCP